MAQADNEAYNMIQEGFIYFIRQASLGLGSEESSPQGDPDSSDWDIKRNREKLAILRMLRERFEDVINGNIRLDDVYTEMAKKVIP